MQLPGTQSPGRKPQFLKELRVPVSRLGSRPTLPERWWFGRPDSVKKEFLQTAKFVRPLAMNRVRPRHAIV
jgi:hypothetical protein